MAKKQKFEIGSVAFLFGIGLAVVTGFLQSSILVTGFLVIAGLAVGFLNIKREETDDFLIASMALIIAGSANLSVLLSANPTIAAALENILYNIVTFVSPAAIIVALKAVYNIASKK